jgi:hypothetical protein
LTPKFNRPYLLTGIFVDYLAITHLFRGKATILFRRSILFQELSQTGF